MKTYHISPMIHPSVVEGTGINHNLYGAPSFASVRANEGGALAGTTLQNSFIAETIIAIMADYYMVVQVNAENFRCPSD